MTALGTPFGAMSVRELQDGLRAREFSAAEVAQATLDVIGQNDRELHAFLELTADMAADAASKVDAAIAAGAFAEAGPLAGVPVGFKDNMNLLGTHTTCSSNMLAD